ncbi:hypothetical protein [Candidatus Tisiphia endosymbiont of Dascillus cervinus]|uniref:tetratricopeptide repeat protein n=1 Tax=Candidatus Tisiphia endosymbiont of Dascillus cervinus TaxID=3066253 RepID=UPI00312C992D
MIFKAYILNIIGKYVEAIKCCDNVINKDQNSIEAWEIKAKACFYLGDEEGSKNIHNIIKSKYDSKLESSKEQKQNNNNQLVVLQFPTNVRDE